MRRVEQGSAQGGVYFGFPLNQVCFLLLFFLAFAHSRPFGLVIEWASMLWWCQGCKRSIVYGFTLRTQTFISMLVEAYVNWCWSLLMFPYQGTTFT